jgi:hypothetical protein
MQTAPWFRFLDFGAIDRSTTLIIRRLVVLLLLAGVVAIASVGCGTGDANPSITSGVHGTLKKVTPAGAGPAGRGAQ